MRWSLGSLARSGKLILVRNMRLMNRSAVTGYFSSLWSFANFHVQNISKTHFRRLGVNSFFLDLCVDLSDEVLSDTVGSCSMLPREKQGVVDPNLKVDETRLSISNYSLPA
jgi:hypothetical protein